MSKVMAKDLTIDELDISQLWEKLSLTVAEDRAAVMDGQVRQMGEQKLKLCLVGRLIANKQVNNEAFRINIPKIWRTNQPFEIKELKNNTFAFPFKSVADKRRILTGEQWHFDNHLLVMEERSEYEELEKMEFNKAEFWTQIHKAPLCCMTNEGSRFLGEQLGKVIEVDESGGNSREESYIRLRVEIDIKKPLKRFLKIDLTGNGNTKLMLVKYERLPIFCFFCGVLGHGDRKCTVSTEVITIASKQYEGWLRATSPQKRLSSRGWSEGTREMERERGNGRVGMTDRYAKQGSQNKSPISSESDKQRTNSQPANKEIGMTKEEKLKQNMAVQTKTYQDETTMSKVTSQTETTLAQTERQEG